MTPPFKRYTILVLAFMLFNNLSAQIPATGLMGWWPFSKNAIDSVKQNNNGKVYGAKLIMDRFGNDSSAYLFDGINDYIDCGSHSDLKASNLSVNFWFKYSDTTSDMVMIGNFNSLNGEWGVNCVHIPSAGLIGGLGAGLNNHAIAHHSNKWLADDRWHMFTLIYNSKNNVLAIYLDACLSGYKNQSGSSGGFGNTDSLRFYNNEHWIMGAASQYFSSTLNNGPKWYNGALDDIRIYNRPLNMLEIHALFHENTVTDTVRFSVYDTLRIVIYDTIKITTYDTVYVSVKDTLYIDITWSQNGSKHRPLKVYPNPSNGKFTIDYGDYDAYSGEKVKIYNIIGQLIYEEKIIQRFTTIDLSTFGAAGHYELVFFGKDGEILTIKRIVLY